MSESSDSSNNVLPTSEKNEDDVSEGHHSANESPVRSSSASPHSIKQEEEEVMNESDGVNDDGQKEATEHENDEKYVDKKDDNDDDNVNEEDVAGADSNDNNKSDLDENNTDDEGAGPSKRRRIVMSSDEDDDSDTDTAHATAKQKETDSDGEQKEGDGEVGVGQLMTNIFGEESDEEKESEEPTQQKDEYDEDEPRYIREEGLDDEEDESKVWDFDEMMRLKKAERRKQKRRRRDGSIYIGNDADEQIRMLTDAMKAAAKDDRHSNVERKPALQKRKMLRYVKAMLIKHDFVEAIIDNGMLSAVSEWLAPLPDKSLPALEIRTDLLKILQDYSRLEQGTLKQSGLGRAVMLLYKHPKETKENKALAHALISEWARPIFQLDTDFHSMTKEQRMERDYSNLSESKKQRLGQNEASTSATSEADKESEVRVGEKGFIMRARVPRPSQRDYVIRPKSNVEGPFRGATKNRLNSRLDRTQREFKERTKKSRVQRALAVSIEGRKMDI